MSYEEFKEYYEENQGKTNGEYYSEFPDISQSTIRSWKSRAKGELTPPEPPAPAPTPAAPLDEIDALQEELMKSLMVQTKANPKEFEGIDKKSIIMILKNRLNAINENKGTRRAQNSDIIPSPPPVSSNKKKYGIDEYIQFNESTGEIKMEIPLDVLFDPKKNKGLGLLHK